MRSALAVLAVTLASALVLAWGTDGFSAFTTETARRQAVLRAPPEIPVLALQDQDGRSFSFADYQGRPLAVQFIYVRCQSVCRSMGASFKRMLERLQAEVAAADDLALLSVSFDPDNDDVAALQDWARQQGADGEQWRVARAGDTAATAKLLAAFGVVVIADEWGGYEHNAAIHLLDRSGRLVRIVDIEAADEVLAAAAKL